MLNSMKKPIVTLLLGAAFLTACSTGGSAEPPATPPATSSGQAGAIAWGPCTDLIGAGGKPATPGPGVECGTLPVPLDHAKPDGEKIGRWMKTYVRIVAIQGVMQVAIIVVMARFGAGL